LQKQVPWGNDKQRNKQRQRPTRGFFPFDYAQGQNDKPRTRTKTNTEILNSVQGDDCG